MYDIEAIAAAPESPASAASGLRARSPQRRRARERPRSRTRTHPLLADLIRVLALERLERDLFRGESRDIGTAQVFGGQVIAQALGAACQTVDARSVHSLHAYFLRRGDVSAPIIYQVERARDGASFSSRRVSATQHRAEILHMAVSFQRPEPGFEHQLEMPAPPERLPSVCRARTCWPRTRACTCRKTCARSSHGRSRSNSALPIRCISCPRCIRTACSTCGFRALGRLPDDACLHHCLPPTSRITICSQPQRAAARGFTRASIFTRDGREHGPGRADAHRSACTLGAQQIRPGSCMDRVSSPRHGHDAIIPSTPAA
jgi:hypothetical protein